MARLVRVDDEILLSSRESFAERREVETWMGLPLFCQL